MLKFIHKRFVGKEKMFHINKEEKPQIIEEKTPTETDNKNKKSKKKEKEMITMEQIERAENVVNGISQDNVKVIKKDKGLIERTESSKIIITEDNRQVLND